MEYACVVWSGAPTQLLSRLDNILVQGMQIATGAPARSNISSLYKETGWQSLETRRHILILKMLYKIINNESANYVKDILLPRLSEVPSSTTKTPSRH